MYQAIKKKKSVATLYAQKLTDQEIASNQQVDYIRDKIWSDLEKKFDKAKTYKLKTKSWLGGQWSGLSQAPKDPLRRGRTASSIKILQEVARRVGLPFEKVQTNMDKYANTSGGTIPIILDETLKNNTFETGDLLLFAAVGAGWTWGTALYKW